jgi:hypothetical protein
VDGRGEGLRSEPPPLRRLDRVEADELRGEAEKLWGRKGRRDSRAAQGEESDIVHEKINISE